MRLRIEPTIEEAIMPERSQKEPQKKLGELAQQRGNSGGRGHDKNNKDCHGHDKNNRGKDHNEPKRLGMKIKVLDIPLIG
jgi:hypothetical protein